MTDINLPSVLACFVVVAGIALPLIFLARASVYDAILCGLTVALISAIALQDVALSQACVLFIIVVITVQDLALQPYQSDLSTVEIIANYMSSATQAAKNLVFNAASYFSILLGLYICLRAYIIYPLTNNAIYKFMMARTLLKIIYWFATIMTVLMVVGSLVAGVSRPKTLWLAWHSSGASSTSSIVIALFALVLLIWIGQCFAMLGGMSSKYQALVMSRVMPYVHYRTLLQHFDLTDAAVLQKHIVVLASLFACFVAFAIWMIVHRPPKNSAKVEETAASKYVKWHTHILAAIALILYVWVFVVLSQK